MLQAIEATNNQGAVLSASLTEPEDGFVIKDIEGLDPVDAILVSSSFANMDGERYQTSRRDKRTLVIKMDLREEYSGYNPGQLRDILYRFFMPKSDVGLRLLDDRLGVVEIKGVVESFKAPLFVPEPEATITVVCHDSDFRTPDTFAVSGETNEDYSEYLIRYDGTVDTGVRLIVAVNRMVNELTFHHRTPDNTDSSIPFLGPLLPLDQLIIDTTPGQKGAHLIRSSAERSVLYGVSPFAQWVTLKPGDNYIRLHAEGVPIPFALEYVNRFGGL